MEKIHGLADRIANKAKDQQKKGLPNTTRVRGQVVKNVVDSVVVSVETKDIRKEKIRQIFLGKIIAALSHQSKASSLFGLRIHVLAFGFFGLNQDTSHSPVSSPFL